MSDDHNHATTAKNEKKIVIAAILTATFMVVEVIGGIMAGSLALIADAGHMLTDLVALGLSWLGFRLSRRPATWQQSYGFDRFSVMAAFLNGIALFLIAGWIVWEAIERLRTPEHVLGGMMLGVAVAGLFVNILSFWILSRGEGKNLNIRSAALHVMGDLLGSIGAIAAALVIMATGWTPIDPILSVFVSVIILRAGWRVVKESGHILLEGAPAHLDSRKIRADLMDNIGSVKAVDHVHAWSITEERSMITLEATVENAADAEAARLAIKERLAEVFGVEHATVEIRADT